MHLYRCWSCGRIWHGSDVVTEFDEQTVKAATHVVENTDAIPYGSCPTCGGPCVEESIHVCDSPVCMSQGANLERVYGSIAEIVLDFCRVRVASGQPLFFASDLKDYVSSFGMAAPASPDRILRELRLRQKVKYVVVCRKRSQYLVWRTV